MPCPYMTLIPVQEPSVMTHTGSFLLKSTGFNIGDRLAIALMLWKHLFSSGVHWKVRFVGLYRNVRINDLNLSVGITNLRDRKSVV